MSKSSHEGASGLGAGHIKRMMKEHGCPDHSRVHGSQAAAGAKVQGKAAPNRRDERSMERNERKDG